jgi:acetoin utilization protein AcuB
MRIELVQDWMTRNVITVTPFTGLFDAYNLLMENRIRRLPVLEDGHLVGILTDSDIMDIRPSSLNSLSGLEMSYFFAQLKVGEAMTVDPMTVGPDETIGQAASIMLEEKISSLPVIDDNERLVGIITESDIFRLVVHDWRQQQQESSEPYTHYG